MRHGRSQTDSYSTTFDQVFKTFCPNQNHKDSTLIMPYLLEKYSFGINFFRKKKQYIVFVCVPSFYLSSRWSSFFLASFLHLYWILFLMTLYSYEMNFKFRLLENVCVCCVCCVCCVFINWFQIEHFYSGSLLFLLFCLLFAYCLIDMIC